MGVTARDCGWHVGLLIISWDSRRIQNSAPRARNPGVWGQIWRKAGPERQIWEVLDSLGVHALHDLGGVIQFRGDRLSLGVVQIE